MPDDKREEWVIQMNEPLPGQVQGKSSPTDAQLEMEGEAFMSLMQQVQGA